MRQRNLDLIEVVHHRRHDPRRRVGLKELVVLLQDPVEDVLPKVGDGREPYVVD